MWQGRAELILLILVFVGLQVWWIIPLIKRNNTPNEKGRELRDKINYLEKLYKK